MLFAVGVAKFLPFSRDSSFPDRRSKVLWYLDRAWCGIGFDRYRDRLTGRNSGFFPEGFRNAEHIFTAHSDDGSRINGPVYGRFDRNTFRPEDLLDVERYRYARRFH